MIFMLAHIHRSLHFILDENNGPFPGFTSEPVDQVIVSENQTILCQGKGKNIFRQKMHITYKVTELVNPMRGFEFYCFFLQQRIFRQKMNFCFFINLYSMPASIDIVLTSISLGYQIFNLGEGPLSYHWDIKFIF